MIIALRTSTNGVWQNTRRNQNIYAQMNTNINSGTDKSNVGESKQKTTAPIIKLQTFKLDHQTNIIIGWKE